MTSEDRTEVIAYNAESSAAVDVSISGETLWATQKQISNLFDVSISTINEHLLNIFESDELSSEATIRKFRIVQLEGTREVTREIDHYNLDSIISVGYRVNSSKATQFRIWATGILRQYVADGYVLNEMRLRNDPAALSKLAAKLRELRANEKNIYASVRECFKLAASDYEPSSEEVRSFYALLQDKFHHAVTEKTSSKLIMDRADHAVSSMGLVNMKGLLPTLAEAQVGKNYLSEDELYRLHLLSEQFLLYAESTALAGKVMTMASLHKQLDNLLKLNGYPVFGGYKDYLRTDAKAHAVREHKMYIEFLQLNILLDQPVDPERFYDGEYAEYKEEAAKISIGQISKSIESENQVKRLSSEHI